MALVDYGRQMVGLTRLALNGQTTRGLDSVVQDCYHALITVRGTLPADASRGLGLMDLVLAPMDPAGVPAFASDIEGELSLDERIASVEASVTADPSGALIVDIVVVLNAGPSFRLIGPIGAVRAEILSNA